MKNSKKFSSLLCAAIAFSVFTVGCSDNSQNDSSGSSSESSTTEAVTDSKKDNSANKSDSQPAEVNTAPVSLTADLFSDRDLSGEYDSVTAEISLNGESVFVDGEGAEINGTTITITDEGVYHISGTLNDGRIIVNSEAKIQLILDNADITCSDSAPIYVANADKVFVTLAEGSENSLTDGSEYVYENETDNEPDAVIFSHDSLTLNGSGSLTVKANYNEGITGKDDIVITGGTINIDSVGNGIKGKDYVALCNAEISINAGGDGIKSTNIEDMGMGFVYVESGVFNITAAEDGIQSDTEIITHGGSFNIFAGGGSANAEPHMNNDFGGGRGGGFFGQTETETTEDTVSTKGIKAAIGVFISDGDFNIDSADDTLHSNSYINISGGALTMTAGGDGIHADSQIDIIGGSVNISQSYEGVEAAVLNVSAGDIMVCSSDDGFNASDGTAQGGMGTYSANAQLNISGGSVYVNADGDGLDSNGDFIISGGDITVDGPTNSGNGALDGNGEIVCNGGTLLAVGSSGMAEYPGNSSAQYSVSATLDSPQQAGAVITFCDADGNELLNHAPEKSFNHIVFSSPDIMQGKTYYIYVDGTEAGSFTADQITSFIGSQGNMMGGGFGGGGFGEAPGDFGGGGFGGGGRGDFDPFSGEHDDFQMPTNADGEIEMPERPQGGFGGGGMMEPPTGEDGSPEKPTGDYMPFY